VPKPVVVKFIGDAANLTGTVGKVEGRFGGLKSKLAALGIGTAIVAGFKNAADRGVELNETLNKVGLAFGSNAGDIQKWAQGSAKNMGLPKQAALEGASSFGLLFSKLGLGAADVENMSKGMVQLAVDLGSVHNADPTEIIEAQSAVFRGEYDALQRFVPSISAATVQQEALAQTGKKNAAALTDQEKAHAVYSLMLKQTTKEQGDFARTSNEAANKKKILAARIADVSANIGTLLLPAITVGSNALGVLSNWVERNRRAATILASALVALAGVLGVAKAVTLAQAGATKIMSAAQAVARGAAIAWRGAQILLNFALSANPIGIVIVAIAALIAILILAYNRSARFRAIVQSAWVSLKAGAAVAGQVAAALGRLAGAMFSFGASAIQGFINGIRSMAGAVISAIRAIIPDPIERFLHLSSPAKEGPLSKDGGPEGWGRKFTTLYAKGMAQGSGSLRATLEGTAGRLASAPARGGLNIGTMNFNTNASAADVSHELAWMMRTSGR
jgi:hypothetical protein